MSTSTSTVPRTTTKPKPAPKRDLAAELFGPEDPANKKPVFIQPESNYPPWTQRSASKQGGGKTKKQKRSKKSRVVGNVFWTITFLIALLAASPMLLPFVKNYGSQAITFVTDLFGLDEVTFFRPASTAGDEFGTITKTIVATVTAS